MAKGENGVISIANFGARNIVVTEVAHGPDIVPGGEAEGRERKHFFTRSRMQGSFSVKLVFAKYDSYKNMMDWLARYLRWMANPNTPHTPARVVVPSRNFDQVGVLTTGITFGDRMEAVIYQVELEFLGAQNPMGLLNQADLSLYQKSNEGLVMMHPSGSNTGITVFNQVGDVDFHAFGNDGVVVAVR